MAGLMNSCAAICGFEAPSAASRAISASCAVSGSRVSAACARAGTNDHDRLTARHPLPCRPGPGEPVYHIAASGHAAQVAGKDLAGPLRGLVMALLAEHGG